MDPGNSAGAIYIVHSSHAAAERTPAAIQEETISYRRGEVPALLAAMAVIASSGGPASAALIAPTLDFVF